MYNFSFSQFIKTLDKMILKMGLRSFQVLLVLLVTGAAALPSSQDYMEVQWIIPKKQVSICTNRGIAPI